MKIIYYGTRMRYGLKDKFSPYPMTKISKLAVEEIEDIIKNPDAYIIHTEPHVTEENILIKEFTIDRDFLSVDMTLAKTKQVVINDMIYNINSKTYDLETDTFKIYTDFVFEILPPSESNREYNRESLVYDAKIILANLRKEDVK